ncbi:MAG: DUF1553 domain-containing protein, partial [Planctomycetales bacterium]|nr:DUF1553 domain-containing protein [Planctomycetales bacterium]
HNGPSHPELLDYLADEFASHSFDLKQLMSWIVLSEPYSLSSRTIESNAVDDPLLGESPKFTHFYLRQMTAEQLYESLLVATQAHKSRGSFEEQEELKNKWLQQFITAFGTDEGDETTTFNGTIPQTLMMFNGEMIKQAVELKEGSFLAEIAASPKLSAPRKFEYLFLAGLSRRPNRIEVRAANQLLDTHSRPTVPTSRGDGRWNESQSKEEAEDPVAATLQDMWWAILNSNEFILVH